MDQKAHLPHEETSKHLWRATPHHPSHNGGWSVTWGENPRPASLWFSPQASDQPPLCNGRCGVALPRCLDISSCGRCLLIHVTNSSIPPFVLTSIQWLALILFVFPCMHVQVQAWMIIPTSNGHFGSPLEGHMRPFGLTFTLGLPPSVWGSIGESPRLWWWVASVSGRC